MKMENTIQLLKRAQRGDKIARNMVIQANMGLIWNVVRRFESRGYEKDELFQIGCIGLIKAIDNFDFNYKVKFSTYAVPMIVGEIRRFFRDDNPIRVSRSVKEIASKIIKFKEELLKEKGREPTINEIAEKLGVELEEVILALESSQKISSLDEVVYQDDGSPIYAIDKISDENKEIGWVEKIVLKDALRKLSPRERKIIFFRYFKDKTQTEIAEILGISQVQVSRSEKKIIEKIKKEFLSEA